VQALAFAIFAMLVYVPAGYFMERFLYQRRMRRRAAGK
jgi:hypothetical protein